MISRNLFNSSTLQHHELNWDCSIRFSNSNEIETSHSLLYDYFQGFLKLPLPPFPKTVWKIRDSCQIQFSVKILGNQDRIKPFNKITRETKLKCLIQLMNIDITA